MEVSSELRLLLLSSFSVFRDGRDREDYGGFLICHLLSLLRPDPYSTPVYQTIMDGILNYPMWYPLLSVIPRNFLCPHPGQKAEPFHFYHLTFRSRAFTAPSGALKDLSDMICKLAQIVTSQLPVDHIVLTRIFDRS
jgi:hypothetical protein